MELEREFSTASLRSQMAEMTRQELEHFCETIHGLYIDATAEEKSDRRVELFPLPEKQVAPSVRLKARSPELDGQPLMEFSALDLQILELTMMIKTVKQRAAMVAELANRIGKCLDSELDHLAKIGAIMKTKRGFVVVSPMIRFDVEVV